MYMYMYMYCAMVVVVMFPHTLCTKYYSTEYTRDSMRSKEIDLQGGDHFACQEQFVFPREHIPVSEHP